MHEGDLVQQGAILVHVDKDVDVASLGRLTANDRTEDAHVPCPVLGGDSENLLAPASNVIHGHHRIIGLSLCRHDYSTGHDTQDRVKQIGFVIVGSGGERRDDDRNGLVVIAVVSDVAVALEELDDASKRRPHLVVLNLLDSN